MTELNRIKHLLRIKKSPKKDVDMPLDYFELDDDEGVMFKKYNLLSNDSRLL